MNQRLARALLGVLSVVALCIAPAPSGQAADCADVLKYWPTTGALSTYRDSNVTIATFSFKLTDCQRQRLEDTEEFVEINFHLHNYWFPVEWEGYVIYNTNLPGAIHDVAASDFLPWESTPGVTAVPTNQLQAGVVYHATIAWATFQTYSTGPVPIVGAAQSVRISWVPVYRASASIKPAEDIACRTLGLINEAWCFYGGRKEDARYGYETTGLPNGELTIPTYGSSIHRFGEWAGSAIPSASQVPYLAMNFNSLPLLELVQIPTPRSGAIVESNQGHLYVYAGGRLFWFDRNNAAQLAAFRDQSQRLTGTMAYVPLNQDAVHAIEVNRTATGAYSPGNNMPADNTWLYEYGSSQQYVVKFQYPFAVGSPQEAIDLGGQNKAVMVPASIADLRTRSPQWVRDDLLQFWGGPNVWHFVDRGYYVPNPEVRDCLSARWNRGVTLLPASAWNYFPIHATQNAACDFGHGEWFYGVPSNRQVQVLYGVGHVVDYGEIAPLGGVNKAKAVSDYTLDQLIGKPFAPPQYHLFKPANSPTVYMVQNGQYRQVGSPSVRDCLMASYGTVVESVPQSFVNRLPQGPGAQCPHEGRLLLHPNGTTVDYVQGGQRRHVGNPAIRDCLMGRSGTGPPFMVEQWVWNSYVQGPSAFCPYGSGANFVRENNSSTVWLVSTNGTKKHAGSLCVPDPYTTQLYEYRVWVVPAGEAAGHAWDGSVWWADGPKCQALPKG